MTRHDDHDPHSFDERELATVRAALRLWQNGQYGTVTSAELSVNTAGGIAKPVVPPATISGEATCNLTFRPLRTRR